MIAHSRPFVRLPGLAWHEAIPSGFTLTAGLVMLAIAWFELGTFHVSAAGSEAVRPDLKRVRTHWAFQPIPALRPPRVSQPERAATPVDSFILEKLEQSRLQPSPLADKRTLLRRATFDLIGLPPTPEEVDSFLTDDSPSAFARVVDRLLASPHYGERWGRHWLDVARYADNKGYVFFEEKTYPWAWTYRDYVIRAFNEDKPFDRFILEQLAADQLDLQGDPRALAALGFVTVGDHFSNNLHDILDDRIDVTFRGLLGLTVGCARCHDHKFDPITTADYYGLYGVFRSASEPLVPPVIEVRALTEISEGFEIELIARERRLRDFVERKHDEIVKKSRARIADSLMAVHAQRHQPATESFMLIADPDDINPVVISRWRSLIERASPTDPIWEPWIRFADLDDADFSAKAIGMHSMLMGASRQRLNPRVAAAFATSPPHTMKDVAARYAVVLDAAEQQWQENRTNLVRGTVASPARLPEAADQDLWRILHGPEAPPDVPAQLDWGFLSLLPDRASQGEFQKLLTSLEQWLMNAPEAPARAMVLQDTPVAYEPRIFLRGNPNRQGASVARRFPGFLDPTGHAFQQGSGRLEMASAIVSTNQPLAARVFVNRVWGHHFGAGLVTTPSDFGLRSEPPSHAALLDWLSGEFIRSGWRVKCLHRLILNSATYQRASQRTPNVMSRINGDAVALRPEDRAVTEDPENRLLSRMNRRRHDFETQRDAFLFVAGLLDPKAGGAPTDAAVPRRTVYTFVNRMDVPPVRTTFDFPSPSTSCPQRMDTTVAPQALYLMNNDFVAQCAAALGRRGDVAELPSLRARIERLHAVLFLRPASTSDHARAAEFLGAAPDERTWKQYIQALLLTNEFVFVD